MPYSLYTNRLLDLILTIVTFDIINQKMNIFKKKKEKVQYRACLAITGEIQGISRQKLYGELDLNSQSKRRWRNKIILFL